jgi:hypothetical protein
MRFSAQNIVGGIVIIWLAALVSEALVTTRGRLTKRNLKHVKPY